MKRSLDEAILTIANVVRDGAILLVVQNPDAGEALTAWLDECQGVNVPSDAQPDTIRRDA